MPQRDQQMGGENDTHLLLRGLCRDVGEIKAHVVGTPGNVGLVTRVNLLEQASTPGLAVRVDRLEQSEAVRKRWIGAAIVTGVGAVGTGIWNLLSKGHT